MQLLNIKIRALTILNIKWLLYTFFYLLLQRLVLFNRKKKKYNYE